MWQLDNRTPFAAERTWTRDRDGAEVWLVALKCTFDITPEGRAVAAAVQPPVTTTPEFLDPVESVASSLRYDIDLVRTKVTTDVIVHANAYAAAEPVTHLDVGWHVGSVAKTLRVTGDRVWRDRAITEPLPFTTMPIVYERAYGGIDPRSRATSSPQWSVGNPLGVGFALSEAAVEGLRLPNVEYPDKLISRWSDRPPPAGFGPIAAHWQPRVRFAGTFDENWQRRRFPLLPDDFDDRYHQCAPADQQAPQFLVGGEPVGLTNLTPGGHLHFWLPRMVVSMETSFYTGGPELHDPPRLHTVIIEPEFPRVSLVWHSALRSHPRVYKLRRTRIVANYSDAFQAPADDTPPSQEQET
jgi:hypothetical protein